MGTQTDPVEKAAEKALMALALYTPGWPWRDFAASLDEALIALVALAEAKGKDRARSVRAVRWARDRIAEGLVLVEPPDNAEGGGSEDRAMRGAWIWKRRHAVEGRQTPRGSDELGEAYDAEAAGRRFFVVIGRAFVAATGREWI